MGWERAVRAADRVADDYVSLAHSLNDTPENTSMSIDLSHIGLDQSEDAVRRRLERIAAALPNGRRIQVGAEEERRGRHTVSQFLVGQAAALAPAPGRASVSRAESGPWPASHRSSARTG